LTVLVTAVAGHSIAVVTLFVGISETISTQFDGLRLAVRPTPVSADPITVVTGFARVYLTVATDRLRFDRAVGGATVTGLGIAVVAFFVTFDGAVPANGDLRAALSVASVAVDGVAVVTDLSLLKRPVSTARLVAAIGGTGLSAAEVVTIVAQLGVAVVALFAQLDEAVAADRDEYADPRVSLSHQGGGGDDGIAAPQTAHQQCGPEEPDGLGLLHGCLPNFSARRIGV